MRNEIYDKIKLILKDYWLGILAGFCISLGGIAFLSCDNKIVGSLFFTVGLFVILSFDFNLFTGKVCFALDNDSSYIYKLISIWLGNLTGAVCTGYLLRATKLISLADKCLTVCNNKLSMTWYSMLILGFFCNVMIFIAVYGYKNFKSEIARTLALFFGVSVFVLCGFEHCVANMFYFSFANLWTWKAVGYLLLTTFGNILGGILAKQLFVKREKKDE